MGKFCDNDQAFLYTHQVPHRRYSAAFFHLPSAGSKANTPPFNELSSGLWLGLLFNLTMLHLRFFFDLFFCFLGEIERIPKEKLEKDKPLHCGC